MTTVDRPLTATLRGTDVSDLERWRTLREGAVRWRPPDVPTTIVVPHPDDEALLFGGLIEALGRRATPITVIAVTDGEAAYPDADGRRLAARRRREQEASFEVLGVDTSRVLRLGLPDGHVGEHVDDLAAAIVECANPVIVAPWRYDHHSDHEACGRAARRAAATLDASLFGGMFWAWHRTTADALGEEELVALDLDGPAWRGRRQALEQHRSQLVHVDGPPVLTDALLEPIRWGREYYVVERRAATSPAPRPAG